MPPALTGFAWDSCFKNAWYNTVASKVDAIKVRGRVGLGWSAVVHFSRHPGPARSARRRLDLHLDRGRPCAVPFMSALAVDCRHLTR